MARIADVRREIIAASPDVIEAMIVEDETTLPDEEFTFDDDDFWEALDLMESSSKLLLALQKQYKISPGRSRIIDNHVADLQHFVALFLAGDES